MEVSMISLVERHGGDTARTRALTPDAAAKNWLRVEFERSDGEPWQEALDKVLALLDTG